MEQIENVWFVIVNPHAGAGKIRDKWKKAEALLKSRGVACTFRKTDRKYHAAELAFDAACSGFRKFIAAGGDGTVHEVLDGIMHCVADSALKGSCVHLSEFCLAVIPIGSGNDWIKSHGVPRSAEEAADLIAAGSFAFQDVVKVSFLDPSRGLAPSKTSYMVNIGGIGFDADICERVNARKDAGKSGRMLYVDSLLYHLMRLRHFGAKVICDGRTVYEGNCLSMALGTGRYSGGGMRQTPEAVFDDGLLDLTVIPLLPVSRILREAYRLFTGELLKVKEIVSSKAKTVTVLPLDGRPVSVEVDGESAGELPARFEVLPEQIKVLHGR